MLRRLAIIDAKLLQNIAFIEQKPPGKLSNELVFLDGGTQTGIQPRRTFCKPNRSSETWFRHTFRSPA